MVRFPAEALAKLASLQAGTVAVGDVYLIPPHLARYFEASSRRPAVVLRVQRARSGAAAVAFLAYGTTKHVPAKRALPVAAGDGGLPRATNFDLGPWLELPTTELVDECEMIGSLSDEKTAALENALVASDLPFRSVPR